MGATPAAPLAAASAVPSGRSRRGRVAPKVPAPAANATPAASDAPDFVAPKGEDALYWMVEVCFEDGRRSRYYTGVIESYDVASNKHHVYFLKDGDQDDVDLQKELAESKPLRFIRPGAKQELDRAHAKHDRVRKAVQPARWGSLMRFSQCLRKDHSPLRCRTCAA